MEEQILSRCGYRCDLCLAYRPNVERNPSNQQKLSDGWFKYFGFRIEPEKIMCNGCIGENAKGIDPSCPVRPCVDEKGLQNCAACDAYICDKLKSRVVGYEAIRQKIGIDIPEDDYISFIQPYENKRRLDAYRLSGKIID